MSAARPDDPAAASEAATGTTATTATAPLVTAATAGLATTAGAAATMGPAGAGELLQRAAAAHPEIQVSLEAFAAFVATRLNMSVGVEAGPALDFAKAPLADLYLVCACLQGAPRAVDALVAIAAPVIRRALVRGGAQEQELADLEQRVLHRLLCDEVDAPAKLRQYAGRASFGTWLFTVAMRFALEMKRARPPEASLDDADLEAILAPADDERAYVTAEAQAAFKEAFRAAMRTLEPRERRLLRHYFRDGVGIEELGALFGVHHTTVSRWLKHTRDRLGRAIHEDLKERLHVDSSEADSFIRLAMSRIDQITAALGHTTE